MSRVTPEEVKVIVSTTLSDAVLQVWIDAASAIVTTKAACIGGDESLLKQIELYLSAHFIQSSNPKNKGIKTKTKVDVIETTFSSLASISDSIDNTVFGTLANQLAGDCLSKDSVSNRAIVEFY
jgi:hypothetical protein